MTDCKEKPSLTREEESLALYVKQQMEFGPCPCRRSTHYSLFRFSFYAYDQGALYGTEEWQCMACGYKKMIRGEVTNARYYMLFYASDKRI